MRIYLIIHAGLMQLTRDMMGSVGFIKCGSNKVVSSSDPHWFPSSLLEVLKFMVGMQHYRKEDE